MSRITWNEDWTGTVRPIAAWKDYEQVDRLVDDLAKRSGFYREGTSERVPEVMKNLLRRMQPDKREMGILLGWLGRLSRKLARSD